MEFATLVSADELRPQMENANWVVVDCRAGGSGKDSPYRLGHIVGAVHADLEQDLAGEIVPGLTGRHPLPDVEEFAETLAKWGVDEDVQVVVYDDTGGSNAVRLWWMLRWLGHNTVAVLDGGFQAWTEVGGALSTEPKNNARRHFVPHIRTDRVVTVDQVGEMRTDPAFCVVDSRSAIRFRGEEERLDPVAGHIPNAVSLPFEDNLDDKGRFKMPSELRGRFAGTIGDISDDHVIFYCGSGVTAAHNILAFRHAGFGEPKMYVGSWSEWITNPSRPIGTGE